ncbi:hypothetical protein ACFRJ9_03195 [Paenarthrobacter sp. NPDC056912]|uniref:hypothetical protein n=1 Tax=Paenarthrobacter sp. NPDC056912 TaxID=3345965 RepID=UPI0036708782
MTDAVAPQVFEDTREQERIIAEDLWSLRPVGEEWDVLEYVRSQTGGRGRSVAKVYLNGEEVDRKGTSSAVIIAVKMLRNLMYAPGKGAWFSMSLRVTPEGDGWEADYNYTDKPIWELGEPSADSYAQELYLYPRDEEHIPDWFKEEMKGATWTPGSD